MEGDEHVNFQFKRLGYAPIGGVFLLPRGVFAKLEMLGCSWTCSFSVLPLKAAAQSPQIIRLPIACLQSVPWWRWSQKRA